MNNDNQQLVKFLTDLLLPHKNYITPFFFMRTIKILTI